MKKILLIPAILLFSSGLANAGGMENLRASSRDISIDTGNLQKSAATAQYEITPTPVYDLITNLLKLIFGTNGDIEITTPPPAAPEVEGTLPDDEVQEDYTEGTAYTPVDPGQLRDSPVYQQPRQQIAQGSQAKDGSIPADLKRKALEYFNANQGRIKNRSYIGIVDFAAHSSKSRFFILDMRSGAVRAIHVSHGRGSDPDGDGFATRFSNTPESKASSLGFYLTGALYSGKHGKSMRLLGQSPTNSNALSRAVVIHESAYVREANVRQGRSFGCLAVAPTEINTVLSELQGGALIYAGLSNSAF